MHKITQHFVLKTLKFIVFWLIFALLFYLVGSHIKLFIPVIGGLILFGIMNPLVKFLEKHTVFNRKWALSTAMFLVVLSVGIILTLFTLLIVREVEDLLVKWPSYMASFKQGIEQFWPAIEKLYLGLDPELSKAAGQSLDKIGGTAYEFLSKTLLMIPSLAFLLPEVFIIFVITLVAAFFITKNWENYKEDMINLFPAEWRDGLREIGKDFSLALVGFLRAQLILVTMTIVLTIIGLYFIGAHYALLVGLIAGLFGILPVLGAGLVLVPWAILEFISGDIGFGTELMALVGILSVIRHVVEPKVLGDNVGLDPLLVLLSMYIGLEVIGPVGLIIGPFVVIFYKSLQKAGVFRNL